jgi:ubiquitin carboxyl-terminal hydrolase 10
MGPGSSGSRRSGRSGPYSNGHHFPHHNVGQAMYAGYIAPYATGAASFYMPHYQNGAMGAMGAPTYMPPYPPNPAYGRSPPAMPQHYMPMVPNPYSRGPQSPVVASPYQAPPLPAQIPIAPHTPSSTHSHIAPPPLTPPVPVTTQAPPHPAPVEVQPDTLEQHTPSQASTSETLTEDMPFRPKLPWYSDPGSPFPVRGRKIKRRRPALGAGVALKQPDRQLTAAADVEGGTRARGSEETREEIKQVTKEKTEQETEQKREQKREQEEDQKTDQTKDQKTDQKTETKPDTDRETVQKTVQKTVQEKVQKTVQKTETKSDTDRETVQEKVQKTDQKTETKPETDRETVQKTVGPTRDTAQNSTSQQSGHEPGTRSETPFTQDQADDAASTSPTTPSSTKPLKPTGDSIIIKNGVTKPAKRSALAGPAPPASKIKPAVPTFPKSSKEVKSVSRTAMTDAGSKTTNDSAAPAGNKSSPREDVPKTTNGSAVSTRNESSLTGDVRSEYAPLETTTEGGKEGAPPPVKPPPAPRKTWADLVKPRAGETRASPQGAAQVLTNGYAATAAAAAASRRGLTGGVASFSTIAFAEALRKFDGNGAKLSFLEPRGLINKGNMCYMNSILQVLIFCAPFHDFLDLASKRKVQNLNNNTLLDAMINFKDNFKVLASAPSAEQLKSQLKRDDYEKFGDAFTPEFVYVAMRQIQRFRDMEHGQQDAQEFLGLLLEGLHDECAHIMSVTAPEPTEPQPSPEVATWWTEVGKGQRQATVRSSGDPDASSPITEIFGGQFRSEIRAAATMPSIILEPYQSLQLDIGGKAQHVVDALKVLTRVEKLSNYKSPRGLLDVKAVKQVLIDILPPVLILHLKRFQYVGKDGAEGKGSTVKTTKKIDYPLNLEIPPEILGGTAKSKADQDAGYRQYKLIAVVYHHGLTAHQGHYTVDVRRQDGEGWIHIDDTKIEPIESEAVAEHGAEDQTKSANRFSQIDGDDGPWKPASSGNKKSNNLVNGSSAPTSNGQKGKHSTRGGDAYLLFYQRV